MPRLFLWLAALGAIAVVAVLVFSSATGDWQHVAAPNARQAKPLIARGWLPEMLPEGAQAIRVAREVESAATFVRFDLAASEVDAFRRTLVPVNAEIPLTLALRHPQTLEGWDDITVSARLRTEAIAVRRPRDGTPWYFAIDEAGPVWAWYAPDVDFR